MPFALLVIFVQEPLEAGQVLPMLIAPKHKPMLFCGNAEEEIAGQLTTLLAEVLLEAPELDACGIVPPVATPFSTHGDATTTYVYDLAGNLIAKTNGAGTTCSNYNNEGRLTDTQAPGDSSTTTYTYDPSGEQLTASGPTGTITNQYDEQGRLVHTIDPNDAAEATFTYDADGNQLSRTAAQGPLATNPNYTTSYTYNTDDQLISETDPASNTYSFFYDDRGILRGTEYPNGTFTWVDTNPDGDVTDQYNRHGTINATTTTPPADTNPLADFTYTYVDSNGVYQDSKRMSEVRTSGSTSQTTNYSYDNLGRLNQVVLPNGTCRQYSYDLDSNRTQIQESPTGCNGTFNTTANYTYDPTNNNSPGIDQLTTITAGTNTTNYAYASDGQTSNQATTNYTWDGWGRLATTTVSSNTITYTYDPTGTLMSRTSSSPSSTTNYLLDDLFETNASGTITTSYTDGAAGDLASYDGPPTSSSNANYLYYDAHGNLAAEANTSGTQSDNHTYDPFGAPTDAVPANTTAHRFTGRWDKQYDTTTGLILMGARPYDPTTGRFLSVDPIPGGSLNNYDYAGQDPIDNYDLSGTVEAAQEGDPWNNSVCDYNGGCGATSGGFPDYAGPASPGTILRRLTSGHATTIAAIATDVAALACTVATDGACAPLAYSALAANLADAAGSSHFGTNRANYKRFGVSAGLAIAGAYGDAGLEDFAKYLDEAGAGGGRVVRGIYGGLKVVLTHIAH